MFTTLESFLHNKSCPTLASIIHWWCTSNFPEASDEEDAMCLPCNYLRFIFLINEVGGNNITNVIIIMNFRG